MSDLGWALLLLSILAAIIIGAVMLALWDYGQQRRREKGSDENRN
jgi:hypothetical protein